MHKGGEYLKEIIKVFQNKYYTYKNIKRFSIPVIGCISSGKSTILNYLLKLKKILQVAQKITTKCICIIRHRKGCKNAKIYNVEIQIRGNGLYNFERKEEIKENVAEVIKERNEIIEKHEIGYNYNKYFLIVEYDIPFFRGDFEKYADLFEFMDIPGLNEAQQTTNSKEDDKTSIMKNFYFNQIFPLIQNNIKFSLFIFSIENYDGSNASEILDSYIEGGIKETKTDEENENNEKLSHSESESKRLKNKKEEEDKNQHRYNHLQSFKNSLFILNKLDLLKPQEREEGKKSFRTYIETKFANEKEKQIKLDDENQIGLIGSKLSDEVVKLDSFKNYLKYYISYIDNDNTISNFYEYLSDIMDEEFKIRKNKEEDDEEEEEEEEEEDNKKNPSYMNDEEFKNYKELEKLASKKKNIINYLTKREYYKLSKKFDQNKDNYVKKVDKDDVLEEKLKKKMRLVIEDYFNIEDYSAMKINIIKDFKIDINKNNSKLIFQRLEKLIKSGKGIGDPLKLVKDFKHFIDLLNEFNENNKKNKTIKKLNQKYENITNYFNNTSAIRFLMVGPHNSGKSSLLNNIIGYNQNLLPTDLKECTKTGVIIKYTKKKEGKNMQMYNTDFIINKEDGYNYFKYDDNDIINLGGKSIQQKIDELNKKENVKKEELKFYLLKAPIEFLDQIGLNEADKEKIELIDFPGLDTKFDQAKDKAEHLLKILDGFIYVNFQTAFSSDNQKILGLIYNTIKRRNDFSFDACLFILNKIDIIEEDINYEDVSKQILKIFDSQNQFEPSRDVIAQKQRFNDSSLSLTGFSSLYYKEYKEIELNISNFINFIKINSKKSNEQEEEKKSFGQKFKGLFIGENVIDIIKNNLKNNYIKINPKNFEMYEIDRKDEKDFSHYLNQLRNILKEEKPKEKDLQEIVKLYMYILKNKKQINTYKQSKVDNLLEQFKNVIKETLKFFEKKKRSDTIKFFSSCYNEILEIYNIIKITMKDDNIDKFKKIEKNKNQIIRNINDEAEKLIESIEEKFILHQSIIKYKINDTKNEKTFKIMIDENNDILQKFIDKINAKTIIFDEFLKEEYDKIINELNLEELEKQKEQFKENMERFNNICLQGDSQNFSDFRSERTTTETYYVEERRRVFLWFKKTYQVARTRYVQVYDHSETKRKYNEFMKTIFEEGKENIIDRINENKETTISNIKGIFDKFNDEVGGFKNNFDKFEKIVNDVEHFIYTKIGLREE